jgi:hypothetical protein
MIQIILAVILFVTGNAAAGSGGSFAGGWQYYLGTNTEYGTTPGSLTAEFVNPCYDLKIETGQFWELAKDARVTFYKKDRVIGFTDVELIGDSTTVIKFNKAFDKFNLTNTTPDPEGVNDLATMTIKGAWCVKGK